MPKMICQEHHWLPMKPMTQSAWQEAMKTAITIVPEVRRLLAEYRAKGDKAYKEKADEKKRTLPGACFQAADVDVSIGTKRYNHGKRGKWREMKHMWLNGLAVIDLDHIADPRKLFEGLMAQFDLKAEGILLAYISASGEGLKIVFRARPEWGNLIDNQYEMADRLGILDKVDDSCKDSSRPAHHFHPRRCALRRHGRPLRRTRPCSTAQRLRPALRRPLSPVAQRRLLAHEA